MTEEYTIFEAFIDLILCVLTIVDMVNTHGIHLTLITFSVVITIFYLLDTMGIYIQNNPSKCLRWFIRGCLIGIYIK